MKFTALLFSVLLGCGVVLAQGQSSGTVNSPSVDPEQNQKLSGSMGTETGQPNDVSRGEDHSQQLGNPSNRPISGQSSTATSNASNAKTANAKSSNAKPATPGGSP